MCVYGIELLPDNIKECRENLLEIFAEYLNLDPADDFYRAAVCVLSQNIIHGDALTMRAWDGSRFTCSAPFARLVAGCARSWTEG